MILFTLETFAEINIYYRKLILINIPSISNHTFGVEFFFFFFFFFFLFTNEYVLNYSPDLLNFLNFKSFSFLEYIKKAKF